MRPLRLDHQTAAAACRARPRRCDSRLPLLRRSPLPAPLSSPAVPTDLRSPRPPRAQVIHQQAFFPDAGFPFESLQQIDRRALRPRSATRPVPTLPSRPGSLADRCPAPASAPRRLLALKLCALGSGGAPGGPRYECLVAETSAGALTISLCSPQFHGRAPPACALPCIIQGAQSTLDAAPLRLARREGRGHGDGGQLRGPLRPLRLVSGKSAPLPSASRKKPLSSRDPVSPSSPRADYRGAGRSASALRPPLAGVAAPFPSLPDRLREQRCRGPVLAPARRGVAARAGGGARRRGVGLPRGGAPLPRHGARDPPPLREARVRAPAAHPPCGPRTCQLVDRQLTPNLSPAGTRR